MVKVIFLEKRFKKVVYFFKLKICQVIFLQIKLRKRNEAKLGGVGMIHHYITKYIENSELYVESWIQVNIFSMVWCFSKRKIKIPKQ